MKNFSSAVFGVVWGVAGPSAGHVQLGAFGRGEGRKWRKELRGRMDEIGGDGGRWGGQEAERDGIKEEGEMEGRGQGRKRMRGKEEG
jgi:hypothetical protein